MEWNIVYFLLLVFCGADVPLMALPGWMWAVSRFLPLARGIASARQIIAGDSLAEVAPLLTGELLSGAATVALVVNTWQGMGLRVGNVLVREPTLEDAYVRLVGGET